MNGDRPNQRPAAGPGAFDPEAVRRRLLDQQREFRGIRDTIVHRSFDEGEQSSVQELSSYDNHPADLGTETFEREKDFGLIGNEEVFLDRIGRSLEKLDEGTYGVCDVCGRPIDPERLRVAPESTRCVECQKETDGLPDPHPRPVEEDVLYPPFGRSWTGDKDGVAFDGEDTWQAVARYGTASGPQDTPGRDLTGNVFGDAEEPDGTVEEAEGLVDEKGEPILDARRRGLVRPPGSKLED
ncbi:MAG TPA: TraR/DksA C4-type zinc finger protein [Bacillota bacterium]